MSNPISGSSLAVGAVVLGVAALIGSMFAPSADDEPPPSQQTVSTVAGSESPREPDGRVLPPPPTPAEAADVGVTPHLVAGELRPGQTVGGALESYGLTAVQVSVIVKALKGVYDFRAARPGARFEVEFNQEKRLKRFRFEVSPVEVYVVERTADKRYTGHQALIPIKTKTAHIGAEVQSSLYNAMKNAGESPALVSRIVDVFAWDLDFYRNTHPGDRFKVIVEKHFKDDDFIRYGKVLAAEYVGKAGTFRTFWFKQKGDPDGHYYLESGESAEKTFLATPLKFARISSGFNRKRKHPVLGYTKAHLGVDYAAPTGTPVWAMAGGKVTYAGWKGANGRLVRIDHGNGLTSGYAHLHRIAKGIKRGVRVRQKQVIGFVGSTGRSTGPHLHFAVRRGGRFVDPRKLKMTRGKRIPRKAKSAFKAQIASYLKELNSIPARPPQAAPKQPAPSANDSASP